MVVVDIWCCVIQIWKSKLWRWRNQLSNMGNSAKAKPMHPHSAMATTFNNFHIV